MAEFLFSGRDPIEAFRDIEARLSKPLFQGVSLGATLTDFFVVNFLNARLPLRVGAAIQAAAARWRLLLPSRRGGAGPCRSKSGRYLLTWLFDTPRINDLVAPVLAEFGPDQCIVISKVASVRGKLPPATGFCTAAQAMDVGAGRNDWRREYVRCRSTWHTSLRDWLRDHRLPRRLFPHLAHALAVRARQVAAFGTFLETLQPSMVLTDAEHSSPWPCLMLAARRRGIPTATMMHGVICIPYGYTPLLSDVAFCWGRDQAQQMIDLGVEPGRLVVTGCQRLARTSRAIGSEVRVRLGLPLNVPIVVLATGPFAREERRRMVCAFGDAFRQRDGVSGVVRLHASEKLDEFRAEMAQYPEIRFLENRQWTVEETMAACDVVVMQSSGLGNDALVFKRLVVLFDPPTTPFSNGRSLADNAGSPVARNAGELRQIVDRIFADADYRQELHRRAEEYVGGFCAAFGQEAARNVAGEIRSRAKDRLVQSCREVQEV